MNPSLGIFKIDLSKIFDHPIQNPNSGSKDLINCKRSFVFCLSLKKKGIEFFSAILAREKKSELNFEFFLLQPLLFLMFLILEVI